MTDDALMALALAEARRAAEHGDVPIGAVVSRDGAVLGAACNERELRGDPTAHAEVLALRAASEAAGTWRLEGASIHVTLEPCPMCAGAIVLARLKRLVYGPPDPKAGAALSLYNIASDARLNHQVEVVPGCLAEECSALLSGFFGERRASNSDPQDA